MYSTTTSKIQSQRIETCHGMSGVISPLNLKQARTHDGASKAPKVMLVVYTLPPLSESYRLILMIELLTFYRMSVNFCLRSFSSNPTTLEIKW